MRINTNVSALNTQRILGNTGAAVAKNMQKLSSGFRINRSGDDAAGLAIANKMRSDVRSLRQASRNAEQAGSILQIMDGAAQTVSGILDRMKELATQSASDNVDNTIGRPKLTAEFSKLQEELDRIVTTTEFQGQKLLTGSFGVTGSVAAGGTALGDAAGFDVELLSGFDAAATFTASYSTADDTLTITNDATDEAQTLKLTFGQENILDFDALGLRVKVGSGVVEADIDTGAGAGIIGGSTNNTISVTASASGGKFLVGSSGDYTSNDLIALTSVDIDAQSLGVHTGAIANLNTADAARSALGAIDTAIDRLSDALGAIGAAQNRVDFATANVKTTIENVAAAESTIRDADMAAEMTEFSKNQILQQAGISMLAQANSSSQAILKLLG